MSTQQVSPDEQKAEQEAMAEAKEEQVREELSKELGLDPNDDGDKEVLDKMVNREMQHRKKLSEAIGQKIKHRTRAGELEGKVPPEKPADSEPKPPQTNAPATDADELKLIARGYSDEEIEKAKVIAKGLSVTLLEAVKDDLFLTFQKEMKEKQKREDAKLGASKGSGSNDDGKPKVKSGMSKEDHKDAWKEAMGNK